MEILLWGGGLRFGQALLQAAPTIVVGLFVAGILRRLLGYENTRRLFGGNSWRSLPQAWAVGMLLPVCSLGVIPIIREMRRVGLSGGTILAFALSAPLFNPLSLLYGLTLSEPLVIFAFAACSLVVVTLIGMAWDRIFPQTTAPEPPPAPTSYGLKRMASILLAAVREAAGPSAIYILIGLCGTVLLSFALPPGSMQHAVNGDNHYAPLVMTGVAIPVYATPMLAMSQLGMMFQHGNSVGAAFVLLALGTGLNLGLLVWMVRQYGFGRAFTWLSTLVVVVLGIAYAVEKPLYPTEIEASDHTHAFDIYCQPFTEGVANPAQQVWSKLDGDAQAHELIGLGFLAALVLLGIGFNVFDPKRKTEAWLESGAEKQVDKFDIVVPAPVLGFVALVGLVAMSIVGCYAYYPPADEIFEEMRIAQGEALSAARSGNHSHAEYWIAVWDDWTRRLQVGVTIRKGSLPKYHRLKSEILRFKLELLEHELEDGTEEEVWDATTAVSNAYRRMLFAYREELSGD
ncbi:permease [Thalassoroseus pseudoceratinae]|uniref:permease n=1 Tax=Thalassoroseus pseudoceratinae TaxID=2713176 RepID=UPI001F0D173F|nr:permease [Thalassoroseus pseudoceratinae]